MVDVGLSGLWVPASARPEPRTILKCQVPGCGKTFPVNQRPQFERHVKSCARKNIDAIQQMIEDRKDPYTEVQDKEQYGWVRKLASEIGPTAANKKLRGN